MSQVVGIPNNSHKPITNTTWVRALLCKLKKGCTRFATASDKVYQLLAHGRWFSTGTPASSTTKTGRHDFAENGVKHNKSINQYNIYHYLFRMELSVVNITQRRNILQLFMMNYPKQLLSQDVYNPCKNEQIYVHREKKSTCI